MVSYFGTNVRQLSSRTGVFIAAIACGELVILGHITSKQLRVNYRDTVGMTAQRSVLLPQDLKKKIQVTAEQLTASQKGLNSMELDSDGF
jgi:hypothetical protein